MTLSGPLVRWLWGLWGALMLGMAGAWGWAWYRQQAQVELPVYGQVEHFELVEASGQPFGLPDLAGRVWIVNFFFSNCTEVCPRSMPEMARLQAHFAGAQDLRLVSITVDPAYDTPALLAEYAQTLGAQPGRWHLLTGDQAAIYSLSLSTFHMAVEALPEDQHEHAGDAFLHDGHFALVDRQAQIRGYYEGLDDEALARLRHETQVLLKD